MNIFDYVLLGVFALFLLIGILKGFIKTILSVAVWGGSIALIYFFGNQLAALLLNTPVGEQISGLFSGFFSGETANLMVTKNDAGELIVAGGAIGLTEALEGANIPVFLHSLMKGMIVPNMTLAAGVGMGMAKYVCLAIVATGILLVLGIIKGIVWIIFKKGLKKMKLTAINRAIGGVLYLGIGFFAINLVMMIIDAMSGLSFMAPVIQARGQGIISNWFAENNVIRMLIELVAKKG